MKKGPLSHQKMKCFFLDYVQLLMICRVIGAMKVNRNASMTLLQSIVFMLSQIYLPKIVRQCGQLSSLPPGSAAHL